MQLNGKFGKRVLTWLNIMSFFILDIIHIRIKTHVRYSMCEYFLPMLHVDRFFGGLK